MLDRYYLTNEDAFFLTFISAWTGVRPELWKDPINLIILIASMLSFVSIISQIRFTAFTDSNDSKKLINIHSLLGLLLVATVTFYFAVIDRTYLTRTDSTVMLLISIIWIGHIFIEKLTKSFALKFDLVKVQQDSSTTDSKSTPV